MSREDFEAQREYSKQIHKERVAKMPEPMNKEEMIDILKGLVFGTFDRTTAKEREALDMAIKVSERTRWIPVSERLPEESIPVILTMEIPVFKDKPRREVVLASCHRFCNDKYKWLTYEDEPSIIDFPIAWMPLPESYKPQESEG